MPGNPWMTPNGGTRPLHGSGKGRWLRLPCLLALASVPAIALADLSFDGQNRFVMKDRRMAVTVVNEGKDTALAEVSLDWGDPGNTESLPLAVSKPLLRIEPGRRATVELLYQGQGLPTDRESYLLLNVLDVPPAPKTANALQIALRHRFKLFYRPALKQTSVEARAMLSWELKEGEAGRIRADNPSPYHVTLSGIEIVGVDGRRCGEPIDHLMLVPFSSQLVDAPACRPGSLNYQLVSDAGNLLPYRATLSAGEKSHGSAQF